MQNETIIAKERIHWAIFVPATLLVILLLLPLIPVAFFINWFEQAARDANSPFPNPTRVLYIVALLPEFFMGLPALIITWVAHAKSEITLTNRRLMFRTGLVRRVVGELPLENIDATFVVEPVLGRLFGYGTVLVTSVGGTRFPLPFIHSPHTFHATLQQAVNNAKRPAAAATKPITPPEDDSRYMPKF